MINRSIAEHTLPHTNRPWRSRRLRAVRAWCVLAAALLVGGDGDGCSECGQSGRQVARPLRTGEA